MKEFWNSIQFVFTIMGGWLGYFLGGYDAFCILIVFMVMDYIMCALFLIRSYPAQSDSCTAEK